MQQPYSKAIKEIEKIEGDFWNRFDNYFSKFDNLPNDYKATPQDKQHFVDCDFLYLSLNAPLSAKQYSIETRVQTQFNALRTAVWILINNQKNKPVPNKLPTNCPKDLFSDKPFLIIKTTDGFKLKCQGEDLSRNEIHEYEFKLPKD